MMKPGKNFIPFIVAITVVGALLHRDYAVAGRVVMLVAIGMYLLARVKVALVLARKFRKVGAKEKGRVVIYGAIAAIFVGGLVTGTVASFSLLVLLAVDFVLTDNRWKV